MIKNLKAPFYSRNRICGNPTTSLTHCEIQWQIQCWDIKHDRRVVTSKELKCNGVQMSPLEPSQKLFWGLLSPGKPNNSLLITLLSNPGSLMSSTSWLCFCVDRGAWRLLLLLVRCVKAQVLNLKPCFYFRSWLHKRTVNERLSISLAVREDPIHTEFTSKHFLW